MTGLEAIKAEFRSWGNYSPSQEFFCPLPEYLILHPDYAGPIDYSHPPMPQYLVMALLNS